MMTACVRVVAAILQHKRPLASVVGRNYSAAGACVAGRFTHVLLWTYKLLQIYRRGYPPLASGKLLLASVHKLHSSKESSQRQFKSHFSIFVYKKLILFSVLTIERSHARTKEPALARCATKNGKEPHEAALG